MYLSYGNWELFIGTHFILFFIKGKSDNDDFPIEPQLLSDFFLDLCIRFFISEDLTKRIAHLRKFQGTGIWELEEVGLLENGDAMQVLFSLLAMGAGDKQKEGSANGTLSDSTYVVNCLTLAFMLMI
ncbi:hypothetical protein ACJX0J_000636 (mitochondrion) [Zea mays]